MCHPFHSPARLAACLLAGLWLALVPAAARGEDLSRRPLEIRFGQVEPPVIAQRDITLRFAPSSQRPGLVALECSGLAWMNHQLLAISDKHEHGLFTIPIDLAKPAIGEPALVVVNRNELTALDDSEAITARPLPDGRWAIHIWTSASNDAREMPRPNRRNFLRLVADPERPLDLGRCLVLGDQPVRRALTPLLEAAGITPYHAFSIDPQGGSRNTYRWGNIEGIAFTPDGGLLMGGLRNPVTPDGKAILFVVRDVDAAFDSGSAEKLAPIDVFTLDLGGRGVSDLCWDSLTRGYIIAAAHSAGPKLSVDQPYPPSSSDSVLFWWTGRKSDPPILFARMPDMTVEAVCRLGNSPYLAIGSDEADASEGRDRPQSVLTVFYFTGIVDESTAPRPISNGRR